MEESFCLKKCQIIVSVLL